MVFTEETKEEASMMGLCKKYMPIAMNPDLLYMWKNKI